MSMKPECVAGGKIAGRSAVLWTWKEARMLHPERELDVVRQRHSDLLRLARSGELAQRLGTARLEERRSFLARLSAERRRYQPSKAAASGQGPC
jgi:hypothetical protein